MMVRAGASIIINIRTNTLSGALSAPEYVSSMYRSSIDNINHQ